MSGSDTGVMASREAFSVGLQQKTQPLIQSMRLAFSADGAAVYQAAGAATSAAATGSTSASPSPSYPPSSGDGGSATAVSAGGAIVNVNVSNMGGSGEPVKRKRGRPRKYGPDGTMAMGLSPAPQSVNALPSSGGFSPPPLPSVPTPPPSGGSASPTSFKKARGRPPGSSKKQQLEALGNRYLSLNLFGFYYEVMLVCWV